jgi:hypothetical protein
LASELCNPKKMRVGKVIVDPPPAMTFMKPAMEPTAKRSTIFNSSSIILVLSGTKDWATLGYRP